MPLSAAAASGEASDENQADHAGESGDLEEGDHLDDVVHNRSLGSSVLGLASL
jgi:hypothetical protein